MLGNIANMQYIKQSCTLVIFLNLITSILSVCNSVPSNDFANYPVKSLIFNDSLQSCGCNNTTNFCLRKCCALNYVLQNETCIFANYNRKFHVSVYKGSGALEDDLTSYSLVSGLMQCSRENGYYMLEPSVYSEDEFFLQKDGKLWHRSMANYISEDQYCLEEVQDVGVCALVCIPKGGEKVAKRLNTIGMIISMPFLLATFIVYILLPEQNLYGKSLMCYVISLFGAYMLIVVIQMHSSHLRDGICTTLAIFCLFFFMVSFFWMNVMSIDMWWTFSGMRGFSGSKRESERKRFLLYSGYCWGVPLILVIIVVCLNSVGSPDKWYDPGIGEQYCWFKSELPTFLYFYAPITVLTIANVILFAKTAWKIKQVQQETAILRRDENKKHSYENDKQRFNLYLKLLLAMGINWSMEIISWLVDWQVGHVPAAVWILTDFCNALYGVFIFFIFVFKKNIWKLLQRRYYMMAGKLHLARTMTQNVESPRTTVTSLTT